LVEKNMPSILIVPEQQTVMAEGLLTEILPPSSALCFEVTNFTRLANTTFRALGGLSGEYCDSAKKSLIMWKTLTELSPVLSMTSGRREINSGLVESALSAVGQMQSLSISPEALAEIAGLDEISSDSRLASKLTDLSSIYSLYKNLLSSRYADSGDDAAAMVKKLRENPDFLSNTDIFIEGFTSFTEPQYALIGILSARTRVRVALTLPKGREDAFEFTEIAECQRRLVSSARKEGGDIKLTREEGISKKKDDALDEICALLWSTIKINDNITLQNKENIRVFEAKTPYDECSFICEDIRRKVAEGASYSDFAILSRSSDKYDGILDRALSKARIPAFTSYKRDIQEFEAVKLIYTAYAVARGFRREDVISFAKCALSGISRDECDEFEMYVNKWQISGRRFTDGEIWNMNPLGYTTHRGEDTDEKLLRIDSVRRRVIEPLSAFAERISSAKTVRDQAVVLIEFLVGINMEKNLAERAAMLKKMGEGALSEENSALWQIICNSLDILVSLLGDSPADADSFLAQLKIVFSSANIGRIPPSLDSVTVGSADMLRLYEKKHIYMLGVNAGQFPASVSDRSYFSERDRIRLSSLGLPISPEMEIKGARELYIFSRAFSYATDSVTLTYSSCDTRFKAIEPSEVIGRISYLTGNIVKPIKISSIPIAQRLYSPECALSEIGELDVEYDAVKQALLNAGYHREISILEGDISTTGARLGGDMVKNLEGRALSLTQTRIDSYVSCPFGYFCRYIIDLGEDERAEFDSRSIGSFIHAILENFFTALSEEGRRSGDLSAEERVSLTRAAAEKYIRQLGDDVMRASPRTKIKIERLCRAALPVVDGLCEEFRQSAFEPRFFELSLGRNDPDSPGRVSIETEKGLVNIYGIIDRVDAYKKGEDVYLRVVDYKTGHKEFSPDDMAEGSNLQMFLYLKALVESENESFREKAGVGKDGRIIPAGVIYVKTAVGDVRVDTPDDALAESAVKSAQGREGMVLDDQDVISAMTLKYTPLYSKRTPDKIPENKKHLLYTEQGWEQIMETVEGAVGKVADGIRRGEISATPKEQKGKSPCEYCPYKPICRKA
jgi:ATP-dependent helicase/nuclease subunit B